MVVDQESFARCAAHLQQLIREAHELRHNTAASSKKERYQIENMKTAHSVKLDTTYAGPYAKAGTVYDPPKQSMKPSMPSIRVPSTTVKPRKKSVFYGSKEDTRNTEDFLANLFKDNGE